VAEACAAADDMRQRVQLYRTTCALGGDKGLAAGVEVGRMARGLLPDSAASKPGYFLMAAALTTASKLLVDGIIGKLMSTAGTMYLQAVTPAVERLISATASLRTLADADMAGAARGLATAAITYAQVRSSGKKAKRADESFEKSR
jgi:hypothetical protein